MELTKDHTNNSQKLAGQIAAGSHGAFKQLYMAFYPRLFRMSMYIVRSASASEEVVSDVFFAIWRDRHTLSRVNNIEAYLYAATRNKAINKMKMASTRRRAGSLAELNIDPASHTENPEERAARTDIVQIIRQTVEQLPPKCRLIFKLAKEDELKYNEISELLNISPRTVNAQLDIAVRRIRIQLKDYI